MKYYIADPIRLEDSDSYEESVRETDDLIKTTTELLNDYYELGKLDYGNPINDLIRYIPETSLTKLLGEYNYFVFQSKDDLMNWIKKEYKYTPEAD